MANVVPMWGGEGTKTYQDVTESFIERTRPQREPDTSEAYRNAKACSEAFEKVRR